MIYVPEVPRDSVVGRGRTKSQVRYPSRITRQMARGTVRIGEPAAGTSAGAGGGSGSGNDTSSDDGEESDENYRISPRGVKRSGRMMRGSSSSGGGWSGHGSGQQGGNGEEEEVAAPGPPEFVPDIRMHLPTVPRKYVMVDYTGKVMTEKARKEREKNPLNLPNEKGVDFRFQTKFHQDYYMSAIYPKNHSVSRSQYVDWRKFEGVNDPIFDEIVRACKDKNVYSLLSFHHDWNSEVIAQFFATCYWDDADDDPVKRYVHWMTDGEWYHISYAEFSMMFGFGRRDYGIPQKIHMGAHLSKEQMRSMYLPGNAANEGSKNGLIPFYGYLNKFFRKTLTPREGDASNISGYLRNLLRAMTPSEPAFSVFDFVWEEIKDISMSPNRSCGYGAILMHMIETKINKRFEYDYTHTPLVIKLDYHPGPTLAQVLQARQQAEVAGGSGTAHDDEIREDNTAPPPPPPPQAHATHSPPRDHYVEKPVSPMRKIFNLFAGICKSQRDIQVEQRAQRIRDKKRDDRLKRMYTHMKISPPCSPPSPPRDEPEIPPLSEILRGHSGATYYDEFGNMFFDENLTVPVQVPPQQPFQPQPPLQPQIPPFAGGTVLAPMSTSSGMMPPPTYPYSSTGLGMEGYGTGAYSAAAATTDQGTSSFAEQVADTIFGSTYPAFSFQSSPSMGGNGDESGHLP